MFQGHVEEVDSLREVKFYSVEELLAFLQHCIACGHFFWIFGHPEVYILIIPCFAFMSEIIPVFSRKPIFGYPVMIAATVCIGFVSLSVWAHHMFMIGMNSYANSFFTLTTMVVGIPTGIKIFNWIGTMWGGRIHLKTPMLFSIGFLFQFLIAGLTGIMMAAAPFAWQLSLSYFVVAHFHYVIAGGILFTLFAAFYYWYPKMTGRMLSERLGKWNFWLFLIGFHLTFDVMHVPGILGMPRRIYTYEPGRGWDTLNFIVSCSWQTSSFLISREPQRVTIPGTRGHWNGPSVRRPQHITLRRFQPWRVAARCGTRSIPRIPIAAMSERTI